MGQGLLGVQNVLTEVPKSFAHLLPATQPASPNS